MVHRDLGEGLLHESQRVSSYSLGAPPHVVSRDLEPHTGVVLNGDGRRYAYGVIASPWGYQLAPVDDLLSVLAEPDIGAIRSRDGIRCSRVEAERAFKP